MGNRRREALVALSPPPSPHSTTFPTMPPSSGVVSCAAAAAADRPWFSGVGRSAGSAEGGACSGADMAGPWDAGPSSKAASLLLSICAAGGGPGGLSPHDKDSARSLAAAIQTLGNAAQRLDKMLSAHLQAADSSEGKTLKPGVTCVCSRFWLMACGVPAVKSSPGARWLGPLV